MGLLEEDGSVFDRLHAELVDIVAEVGEEGVGQRDLVEAKLNEEHLLAQHVEILGH